MVQGSTAYQVFISHSSADTWVARQIARHIEDAGASTFLDEADIRYGDDIEERILAAVQASEELVVLLTPWALTRPYIWLEIGALWGREKRIVGVLHGISTGELITREGIPALLKRINLLDINGIDEYFQQLAVRVVRMRQLQ